MVQVTKHFVKFLSPGSFTAEQNTLPVDSWDVESAMASADDILQRHGATPYGFYFVTRSREDEDLDSHVSATSGTYYLGGVIETVEEIAARGDPSERILLENMLCNKWDRVITNTNSWKWTQPFKDGDVLLDYTPKHRRD